MATPIWQINDPDKRYARVFQLAVEVFGDEDAEPFMDELHRGHMAMALGAPDMNSFVQPGDMVRDGNCQVVVEYLESKLGTEPH